MQVSIEVVCLIVSLILLFFIPVLITTYKVGYGRALNEVENRVNQHFMDQQLGFRKEWMEQAGCGPVQVTDSPRTMQPFSPEAPRR